MDGKIDNDDVWYILWMDGWLGSPTWGEREREVCLRRPLSVRNGGTVFDVYKLAAPLYQKPE